MVAYIAVVIALMLLPSTVTARPRFLFAAFPLFISAAAWWPRRDRAIWDLMLVGCGAGLTALTALYGVVRRDPVNARAMPQRRRAVLRRALDDRAAARPDPRLAVDRRGGRRRRRVDRRHRELLEKVDDPRVRVLYHERNTGKGAALRTGFAAASAEYVIVQDADLEYDPTEYGSMLEPLEAGLADVVFGSRFLSGRPHRVLYYWHSLGNRLLTLLSNMFTNLNLTDMETCFKAFRREVLDTIVVEENRFGFEPEITAKVARGGWRIYEVGIAYAGRTYAEGKKISWRDGVRAFVCIVRYSPVGQRFRWSPIGRASRRRATASASRRPQRVTSTIDSSTMRPDIFDCPRRRSANTIGVSITRYPPRTRRRTSSVRNA